VPILLLGEAEGELMGEALPVLEESGKPFYARLLRTKRVRNMRVDECLRAEPGESSWHRDSPSLLRRFLSGGLHGVPEPLRLESEALKKREKGGS